MIPPQRYMVGSIECLLAQDGRDADDPGFYFANAPQADLERVLRGRLDKRGMVVAPCNCLLIRSDQSVALVDTGFGEYAAMFGAETGGLRDTLEREGIAHDAIDTVVITHFHPDHIGGLVSSGHPAFPVARHLVYASELGFWTSPESLPRIPKFMSALPGMVEEQLRPLREAGLLEPVEEAAEVLPGARMLPAPGHTPGHAVVEIASGAERLLFVADAILHELNFERPEWVSSGEIDADLSVETRKALLERAVDESSLLLATHLPRGGTVERGDGGFRFQPV